MGLFLILPRHDGPRLAPDAAALIRGRWPDHPLLAPGGPLAGPPPRETFPPGPDPADWIPSAEAPPHAPPPPTLHKKARTFAAAAIQHVAAGMPTVDEAERARRLGICGACEHYRDGRCGLCGCVMGLKASWALSACPDNPPRW